MDFSYAHTRIPKKELDPLIQKLYPYLDFLRSVANSKNYAANESSLSLPSDTELIVKVLRIAKEKVTGRLKYVVVIGIGGSSLGTKAVYHALRGYADAFPNNHPKMFFVDTTDPEYLTVLLKFLKENVRHPEEIIIHIASKSGTTTEIVANAEIVLSALKKIKHILDRVTVATDLDSPLARAAENLHLTWMSVPPSVGGRFSVMSPVALLPLAFAKLDIKSLMKGAKDMLAACLAPSTKNPAALSATMLSSYARKGKNIHDTFFFCPELIYLGDWYRQLLAESIGKEKDLRGKIVRAGITPTTSIGSTDLHSVAQLTLGGPRDKVTTFVSTRGAATLVRVPAKKILPMLPHLARKSAHEILRAIYHGTTASYAAHKLPFCEVFLPDVSEYSLGTFMQWKMVEVMLLGKLMKVNAFDQPNVEDYKRRAHRMLGA